MAERWTPDDDRALRHMYAAGEPVRKIAAHIGRSEAAVSERRRTLGMPARRGSRRWSAREDDLVLAAAAQGLPATALIEVLDRSAEEIQRRKRALTGLRQGRAAFSAAEDALLTRGWSNTPPQELAARLHRSPAVVRARARRLGLYRSAPQRPRWTPEEDAIVREGYAQARGCGQIAAQLRDRSPAAVATRAARLGLVVHARAWSSREDQLLAHLADAGVEPARIAMRLQRTPDALRSRARRLRIVLPAARPPERRGRRWNAADDALLRTHHTQNPAMLAELLGRTPAAVVLRMRSLGLRDMNGRTPHRHTPRADGPTASEVRTVRRELLAGGPRRPLALAKRLGRTPAEILAMAERPAGQR